MSDDLSEPETRVLCCMVQGEGVPLDLRGYLPALAMRGMVRKIGAAFEGYMLATPGHEHASRVLEFDWRNDVRVDADVLIDAAAQPRDYVSERADEAKELIIRGYLESRTIGEMARLFLLPRAIVASIIRAHEAQPVTQPKETTT